MLELLQAAVSVVNLPYTILLGLLVLYWALYLLGVLGDEASELLDLDFDADVDVDADVGVDADADADVDSDADVGHPGVLSGLLHFFHVGEVPVIIIFSTLILAMWTLSLLTNYYLNNTSGWVALALAIPIVLGGLIVTKTVISPFAPWLKKVLHQEGDKVEILGRRCVVHSSQVTPKYGQIELATQGAPILLNAKTKEGVVLTKGQEAIVFDYDKEANVYLIAALDVDAKPNEEK